MQSRVGATGDWTDHDDVINPNDVVTGSHYRCVFRDADGEDSESNIIRIVDGKINPMSGILTDESFLSMLHDPNPNTTF